MRSLLIQTNGRVILIDTGLGNKQSERFFSFYEPHGANIEDSLRNAGLSKEDVTDVFLTHLHFDHVGGAVERNDQGQLIPAFPNATYWSNRVHYDWAVEPNARERASFLKENFVPLMDEGVLKFAGEVSGEYWMDGIRLHLVNGHTSSMMLPEIELPDGRSLLYCADLMPSAAHVNLPWVMAYDMRPLTSLEEKSHFLNAFNEEGKYLFFEHDKEVECAALFTNDRGRIAVKEQLALSAIMNAG